MKALAAKGEGLKIEFKKKAAFPEKIVREVIALANTAGGDLVIGVDDDGTVSGQRYIEEEIFVMEKAIRELIFPALSVEVFTVKLSKKKAWLSLEFRIAQIDRISCLKVTGSKLISACRIEAYRRVERYGRF